MDSLTPHDRNSPDNADLRREFDKKFTLLYNDLRRIAASLRRMEVHFTLGRTALVHEAWLRLREYPELASVSEENFKGIAARVIRRILVEAARARNAEKRGGPGAIRVSLDESSNAVEDSTVELLVVDEAIKQLGQADERQARLAELKIFSDLTNPEIAAELGVSLTTVEREWRASKAWLKTRF